MRRIVLVLLVFCVFSCSRAQVASELPTVPPVPTAVTEEPVFPPEAYGPPESKQDASPAVTNNETAPISKPSKLCIILGPGMAKAIAHAGVLEVLRKGGLPLDCILGTEMGALVGALYSQSRGSANAIQWQLFKLNKQNYFNFPLLSLREPRSSGKKMHELLRLFFKQTKIENLPIPFASVLSADSSDDTWALKTGDLANVLSANLAIPGVFDSWQVDEKKFVSGAVSSPIPTDVARDLGGNFFVFVDVLVDPLNPKSRFTKYFTPIKNLIRIQKKEASFVIAVPTGAFDFDDFGRQGEILSAGTKAAESALANVKANWEKWLATPK